MREYPINCWNCLGEFDAVAAIWCSCNPNHPTKVCPFCLQCFCAAPEVYKDKFWAGAPEDLIKDREMLASARGPLGQALVQAKVITSDQLLLALKHQKKTGGKLGEILVELGFLTQQTLAEFLSKQRSVTKISLKDQHLDPMLVSSVGAEECLKRLVVPLNTERMAGKEMLTLAMANPSDGGAIEYISNLTGCMVLPVQASPDEIKAALVPFVPEGPIAPAHEPPAEVPPPAPTTGAQMATDLLRKALARGASDLYLEPKEEEVSVHLRIDGILYKAKPISRDIQDILTMELKRLLRLDTALKDRPQEGRVVMRSGDQRFDVIAHCLPTRFGENLSLRIINRDTFFKSYGDLGVPQEDQLALRAALSANRGLILITAPLFHGSTTTLYGVMKDLASDGQRKLMSIEAQSVCPVPNVSQVSLGEKKDDDATLTTLKALANIQPDVCVLADLLDSSTMAVQILKLASQMLVVATLEASHCAQAIQKLLDLGAPPAELAQHLLLVINQRLVRRICTQCVVSSGLSERSLQLMGLSPEEAATLSGVSQGQGCETCSGIGYKGRIALFETLTPSQAFRKALSRGASEKALEKEAVKSGMVPLRIRALKCIQEGRTTIEEFQKEHF